MFCFKCGSEIEDGNSFCKVCGAPIVPQNRTIYCPKCGNVVPNGCDFCGECGNRITPYKVSSNNYNQQYQDIMPSQIEKTTLPVNNKRKSKLIIVIGCMAVFAVVFAVIIFLYLNEYINIPKLDAIRENIFASESHRYTTSTNIDYYYDIEDDVLYTPDIDNIVTDDETGISFVNNMVIIVFSDEASKQDIESVIQSVNGEIIGKIGLVNQYQVQIQTCSLDELKDIVNKVETNDCVLFAHYDRAYQDMECSIAVNDPWAKDVDEEDWLDDDVDGSNWWLEAIEAPAAWEYNDIFSNIKIGIVDAGFDTEHEDVSVTFPAGFEALNYADDHGTHVAGIIGATPNNGRGITGIVWNSELICFDWKATDRQDKTFNWNKDTMIYAGLIDTVETGAKVVNFSLGDAGTYPNGKIHSQEEIYDAGKIASGYMEILLRYYDFVVVQSAGNGGIDAENALLFAAVNSDNCVDRGTGRSSKQNIMDRILTVGAVQQSDTGYMMSIYSDGDSQVDIVAPGGDNSGKNDRDIYSTVVNNDYDVLAGTSMSAPMVTGVTSLVWSVNEEFTGAEVAEIVRTNYSLVAIDNPSSTDTDGDFPIVNAKLAVEEAIRRTYPTINLSGTVTDEDDNTLDDVMVTLTDSDNNEYETITTENGQYSFEVENEINKDYILKFEKEGYYSATETLTKVWRDQVIDVKLEKDDVDDNQYCVYGSSFAEYNGVIYAGELFANYPYQLSYHELLTNGKFSSTYSKTTAKPETIAFYGDRIYYSFVWGHQGWYYGTELLTCKLDGTDVILIDENNEEISGKSAEYNKFVICDGVLYYDTDCTKFVDLITWGRGIINKNSVDKRLRNRDEWRYDNVGDAWYHLSDGKITKVINGMEQEVYSTGNGEILRSLVAITDDALYFQSYWYANNYGLTDDYYNEINLYLWKMDLDTYEVTEIDNKSSGEFAETFDSY